MESERQGRILEKLENLERGHQELKKQIEMAKTELKTQMENHYVTQDEFQPISRLMQAIVALILAAFFAALSTLVYSKVPK
jgi:hypothetical protein